MAFCGYNNLAQVTLSYTYFQQVTANTLYFLGVADWTPALLEELAEAMIDWWQTECRPQLSNSLTLVSVEARDLGAIDSWVIEEQCTGDCVGDVTDAGLPGSIAMVIKFASGLAGRSKRGRNYVMGWGETRVTGNEFVDPATPDMVASYEMLVGYAGSANSSTHVVFSRVGCDDIIAAGDVYPVIGYSSDGLVHTQRRRLLGVGS